MFNHHTFAHISKQFVNKIYMIKQLFFFLFTFSILSAQKTIKVIDAETNSPIASARILSINAAFYTNEEGKANVTEEGASYDISKQGYQTQRVNNLSSTIALKPSYKDIEEVKIIDVNIADLLHEVQKRYSRNFNDRPIVYDITVKQKMTRDLKLYFLLIADEKLWRADGAYNLKYGLTQQIDKIEQVQLTKLKYFKTSAKEDDDYSKESETQKSQDGIGGGYMNYFLFKLQNFVRMKGSKVTGRLLTENGDEQEIYYHINTLTGIDLSGLITYNKADKAITKIDMDFDQSHYPAQTLKRKDGTEYKYQLGNGKWTLEYYKSGKYYYPSLVSQYGSGFNSTYGDVTHEIVTNKEIIFHKFEEGNKNGLPNKLDRTKPIWQMKETVASSDSNNTLLTKEEQEFINQK